MTAPYYFSWGLISPSNGAVREFFILYFCVKFWRNFLLLSFTSIKKSIRIKIKRREKKVVLRLTGIRRCFVLFVLTGLGRRQLVPGYMKRKDE